MIKFYQYIKLLVHPHGKAHFLLSHHSAKVLYVLDVGCGNNSARYVKKHMPKCYYIGVDVGDYNIKENTKALMDEYYVVPPEKFADKIEEFKGCIDIVISSHNIEHCNEPMRVLDAMCAGLKGGGSLYMSFPSEASTSFPHRKGTLNFFDDSTHQWCPQWNDVIETLKTDNVQIQFASKKYRPFILKIIGYINESRSRKEARVLRGTWEYYGFESIIWGRKHKE